MTQQWRLWWDLYPYTDSHHHYQCLRIPALIILDQSRWKGRVAVVVKKTMASFIHLPVDQSSSSWSRTQPQHGRFPTLFVTFLQHSRPTSCRVQRQWNEFRGGRKRGKNGIRLVQEERKLNNIVFKQSAVWMGLLPTPWTAFWWGVGVTCKII